MRAIHIGFPKTATTFLQTEVFPRLAGEGLTYVPRSASARLFASLIDDDDTIFDAVATTDRVREQSTDSTTALFSDEGLTGEPYGSGFVNRSQIARRLRRVGFERALITIRNQFDVLESAYKQHVKAGGVLRFRDYASLDPGNPTYLHPRYFDYRLIYDLYATTFGRENVLILQYEELDEPSFLRSLTDFLGLRPIAPERRPAANQSLSYEKTVVLRLLNHFTFSTSTPPSLRRRRFPSVAVYRGLRALPFGNSGRSFLTPADRSSIADLYAESNRRLAAAAGITLAPEYP